MQLLLERLNATQSKMPERLPLFSHSPDNIDEIIRIAQREAASMKAYLAGRGISSPVDPGYEPFWSLVIAESERRGKTGCFLPLSLAPLVDIGCGRKCRLYDSSEQMGVNEVILIDKFLCSHGENDLATNHAASFIKQINPARPATVVQSDALIALAHLPSGKFNVHLQAMEQNSLLSREYYQALADQVARITMLGGLVLTTKAHIADVFEENSHFSKVDPAEFGGDSYFEWIHQSRLFRKVK